MEPPVKTSLTPSVVPRVLVQISTKPRVFGSQPPRTPCNCLPLRAPNAHRVRTKSRRPVAYGRKEGCTTSPEAKNAKEQRHDMSFGIQKIMRTPARSFDPGDLQEKPLDLTSAVMVNNDKNESWFWFWNHWAFSGCQTLIHFLIMDSFNASLGVLIFNPK